MTFLGKNLLDRLRDNLRRWLAVPDGVAIADDFDRVEGRLAEIEVRVATCEGHHQVFGRRNP